LIIHTSIHKWRNGVHLNGEIPKLFVWDHAIGLVVETDMGDTQVAHCVYIRVECVSL
jgi:hypothetical protein